jgi:hypothetical protein
VVDKEERKFLSFFSTNKLSTRSKALIQIKKQINESPNQEKILESSIMNANKTMPVEAEEQEVDEDWEMVGAKNLNKIRRY